LISWLGRGWVVPLALWGVFNAVILRYMGLHPWTFLARCDGLALGALLAVWLPARDRPSRRSPQALLVVAGVFAVGYLAYYATTRGRPLKAFDHSLDIWESLALLATNIGYTALVGLVVCNTGCIALGPLRSRVLGYAGRISFGVYIFSLLIY